MIDLDMGAYGGFVWPSWIISAVVLAALAVRSALAARRWRRELSRLQGAEPVDPAPVAGSPLAAPDYAQVGRSPVAPPK